MDSRPPALPSGTLLSARFSLESVLGQGTFGITYLAQDRTRGDFCVVRELAPLGAEREASGILRLSKAGEPVSQRLRQAFTQESTRISRLSGSGLPLIRSQFVELGTAFLVREYLPGAMTLAQKVIREGRQSPEFVERLLLQLSETLEHVHANGALHLDLRPSNILVAESGMPYLIDFGDARRWQRDLFGSEESLESLPPELRLRGSRIGPETDIYQLGAALYGALVGFPPEPRAMRLADDLEVRRPDSPRWLTEVIERALREDPGERPRSARELAAMKEPRPEPTSKERLDALDQKRTRLHALRFDRRQCPNCHGVLEEPRQLKLKVCPVCHEGTIRPRKVIARLCPHCRSGILKHLPNLEPLAICPACAEGLLQKKRRGPFSKAFYYACPECDYEFDWQPPQFLCVSGENHIGESRDCADWRRRCGRSAEIWLCNGCGAQYDRVDDGRWRQAVPAKTSRYDTLEPDEWDRVAAGLPPEAGNAECDACGADYFVDESGLALLEARFDPHGFAHENAGRLLSFEAAQWVGVGKESPHPGLTCSECQTEFDFSAGQLKLVRTPNFGMLEYASTPLTLENWHRAAADLPLSGKEADLDEALNLALREAYIEGVAPFSARDPELIWKGHASRMEATSEGWKRVGEGQFVVDQGGLRFGGMFKKALLPLSEVEDVTTDGVRADFELVDGDTVTYDIHDVEWTTPLASGNTTIRLSVFDLVARLRRVLEETTAEVTGDPA